MSSNNIQSTNSMAFYDSQPRITEVRHFTEMPSMPITSSNVNISTTINTTTNSNINDTNKCNIYNLNYTTHKGNSNNGELQHV